MKSDSDKATQHISFIEKSLKVAGVFYVLAIFFYVVGKGYGGTLSSKTAAAIFCGVLIYSIVSLVVWRFRHKDAALSYLRERWIKCLVYAGAMAALIIGPILLSVFFPVEK